MHDKSRYLPPEDQLLPRDEFRRLVFLRAGGKCVFCGREAVDAHHILERKLFPLTGGYYLGNGAAVCEEHHWECEMTVRTVEEVRIAAGIRKPMLPDYLDTAKRYDKWGNLLREDGLREAGPLARDDGMRRALTQGRFISLLLPAVPTNELFLA